MAAYLCVNTTEETIANVNAANYDLPANSMRTFTLTDTELGVLASTVGVAVLKSTATYQIRREAAKILKHYKSATGAAL